MTSFTWGALRQSSSWFIVMVVICMFFMIAGEDLYFYKKTYCFSIVCWNEIHYMFYQEFNVKQKLFFIIFPNISHDSQVNCLKSPLILYHCVLMFSVLFVADARMSFDNYRSCMVATSDSKTIFTVNPGIISHCIDIRLLYIV